MMERIELNKSFIELLAPNIILVTIKDNCELEEDDIREMKKISLKLTHKLPYVVVTESGNNTSISKKAREVLASREIEINRKAIAFVFNNLAIRLLARFYVKINKPKVPTKSFSDRNEAISWVKEYL